MARVLIIRQGRVPGDPRVRRELDALVAAGHEVDVICRRPSGAPRLEREPRLTIHRIWALERTGTRLGYVLNYAAFMVMATALATWLHLRRRYDMVQVHSLPDSLVFAALVPKLTGARVMLDLQETMPEFFASRFGVGMDHPGVRMIGRIEQRAIRFADHVLTCTNEMRAVFLKRGAPAGKITVILNSANEDDFDPVRFPPRPREAGRFDLICHGTIEERYGLDTVVRAVAQLRDEIPELRFVVVGDGMYRAPLQDLAHSLGVADRVLFSDGFVTLDEMVTRLADADVGVVAMKRDVFRDLTHCNKMFDFITMRRPQIVSRTASVEAYFDEDCFEMFIASDVDDLARAIRRLHASPERCERLVEQALTVAEPYRWQTQRRVYLSAVSQLLQGPALPGRRRKAIRRREAPEDAR